MGQVSKHCPSIKAGRLVGHFVHLFSSGPEHSKQLGWHLVQVFSSATDPEGH